MVAQQVSCEFYRPAQAVLRCESSKDVLRLSQRRCGGFAEFKRCWDATSWQNDYYVLRASVLAQRHSNRVFGCNRICCG